MYIPTTTSRRQYRPFANVVLKQRLSTCMVRTMQTNVNNIWSHTQLYNFMYPLTKTDRRQCSFCYGHMQRFYALQQIQCLRTKHFRRQFVVKLRRMNT